MNKFLFALCLLIAACNTNSTKPKGETKAPSLEDSLYKATMDIHNEIMPKMGKLIGYEKLAQKQSDSIKSVMSYTSFPVEVSRRIASDVNTIDTLNENLKAAEKAMNDWMEQFNADPKMPTTEERAAYFADQKQKATAMKEQFMQALQQAEQFFDRKQ